MIPDWWQAEINRWGGGYEGAPPLLGFSTVSTSGLAAQKALVDAGKTWYVYPDSGVSQSGGGQGAEGPYTLEEARSRQKNIRATTPAPALTTTQIPASTAAEAITKAADTLKDASQPTVPNFVQPYQQAARGFGAYGERDIF